MTNDSLVFYVSFPIKGDDWQVQCSLTASCDDPLILDGDEKTDVIRIMHAKFGGVTLDESAWRELLKEHDLLSGFCEQMMTYLSYLTWTLSKPIAKA